MAWPSVEIGLAEISWAELQEWSEFEATYGLLGSPGETLRAAESQQLFYNANRGPKARALAIADFLPAGFAAEVIAARPEQTDEEFEAVLDAMVEAGENMNG